MWKGSFAVLLSICLLKAAPASSFGGALFVKPLASSISGSPTSDAASTATLPSLSRAGTPGGHATPSPSRVNLAAAPGWLSLGSAHRPGSALTAKYDTLEEAIAFARAQGGGDPGSQGGDGEEEGGDGNDSKDGDGSGSGSKEAQKKEPKKTSGKADDTTETAKKTESKATASSPAKTSAAKPAAKKSGGGGGMMGWNWGFKSTPAKPSKKPSAEAAAKPSSSDTDAKASDAKEAEAEAANKKTAAATAAAAAKKEAEAKEGVKAAEEKNTVDNAKASATEATAAAKEKAATEAAAAAAAGDAGDKVKAKEEEAAQKKAAADAAADSAAAEKAEKIKAKNDEAARKKAAAKAAADAVAAEKAEKIKAKNEEAAQKKAAAKAAADAAAAARTDKIKAKKDEIAQRKAAAQAAADAKAAAKADAIKAKENEAAQKKAAAKAAADAAAAAIADEAAKKRAASAEAAAATAAKEKRAETIAAIARGDEPKVAKVDKDVKPKEATPPAAEEQKKGGDNKKDMSKGDAARAAAAAAAPAAAAAAAPPAASAAPSPAAATPAAATPAAGADADAAKDVTSDSPEGSADAPADSKGGEVENMPAKKAASKGGWSFFGSKPKEPSSSLTLSKPETIVVVTGATGRVGQLAVRRILELYPKVLVRAVVNDFSKGSRLLKEEKDTYGIKLEIMSAELSSMRSAARVVEGASAVVFCASGYAQNLSPLQRLANAVRLTINPKSVTDVEGVRDVALALKAAKKIVSKDKDEEDSEPEPLSPDSPRFVLLSSAAVTRPNWSNEDKALYPLAADVPIVKLNPLNILTVKAEGEKELREVGIPYTVVRPCGLNDDHPRGRPLFSAGDTAAGRICREDVADVLVRCLGTKEATGKTFEVQSLPGLDKVAPTVKTKAGIDQALSNLPTDKDLEKDPDMLNQIRRATYPVLTQLRPVPLAQANRQQD